MKNELTLLGIVAKTHGYKGELICRLEGFTTKIISDKLEWIFIKRHGEKVPYRINELNKSDDWKFILSLKNVENEEEASKLVGSDFYLIKNDIIFDEVNKLIESGLIGWKIYDKKRCAGEVVDYFDNKSQILLSVRNEKKEFLLPLADDLILNVDNKNKILSLDFPEGLDDL
ncbi:MAG: 16S rRNA processing protein RimM [Bacteroidetes bacterium CG2_30_33_31]|nr:MAG: 16S rRNA processing protein RimM [Bacteroidetes bacterium CG2_30_33_31]